MNKLFLPIVFFASAFVINLNGQGIPVYNHYFNNASLYNPAEIGSNGFTTIRANYRQQWLAIKGAPKISTLNFETPFDNKHFALGATVRNYERGLLNTTDLQASYSYRIYLSKTVNVDLGLSAGVSSNSIDMQEIDAPDDPILDQTLASNMQMTARFGVRLHSSSGLNLGISMPQLMKPSLYNSASFNTYQFSPVNELIVMAYYKKIIDKKYVVKKRHGVKGRVKLENVEAPLQFFAIYKYSKYANQRIEFMTKLNVGDNAWVGAAYRLNYGIIGMLGVRANNVELGYAYEPASKLSSDLIQGTHELQLAVTIGHKKRVERKAPLLQTVHHDVVEKPRYSEASTSNHVEDSNSKHQHYIVLKVFKDFRAADAYKVRVQNESEIETEIYFDKEKNKYYVYIFKTDNSRDAKKELKAVLELTKYKRAEIITLDH